jgi:bile acid:Na+ symporter, BASS family
VKLSTVPRLLSALTNAFPLWVLAGGVTALFWPGLFTWFSGAWIVGGLAVIMLGMGITLSVEDFRRVGTMPRPVLLGLVAQYTIMPFLGWAVGRWLALEPAFAVGLVLVACCPGGTASNVVTYLARANVALSVVMTMVSTFAAVFMTPLLTRVLAGALVDVDALGLFLSTLEVVVAPVILGILLNRYAPRLVAASTTAAPLLSVVTIALICSSIIGQSAAAIRASAPKLLASVFLLHAGGFGLGYLASRLFGYDHIIARTVSIEVGMQNSGLGVVLARRHFADPLTAVPCAISSVFHSVIGSILAGIWRLRPPPAADPRTEP